MSLPFLRETPPLHCCASSNHRVFSARIESSLNLRREQGRLRERQSLNGAQDQQISVGDQRLVNFCSNDYLGLASDTRLSEALIKAANEYGVGSGASHLVCGHHQLHTELEVQLAAFTGREAALVFSSGYAANTGVINALLKPGDIIFQDRLNHASLLDGGWVSRGESRWFNHKDYRHLLKQLTDARKINRNNLLLVATDGVFSMDGDTCDLDALVDVCDKYDAALMIDDAHGIGCVGERGVGLVDSTLFTSKQIPILVGTFGKAFGCAGAFVAGDKTLIDYLVQFARPYVYTTAMPPSLAAAALKSLEIIQSDEQLQGTLKNNIAYFKNRAAELHLPVLNSATAIQPLLVGENEKALLLSERLKEDGFLVSAIRPPTVPEGTARLRITLTAKHNKKSIEALLQCLYHNCAQLGLLTSLVCSENRK